jgi:hypothetical protein
VPCYTRACTLVTLVSYLARSNIHFSSLDAVRLVLSLHAPTLTLAQSSPVIGIVFCLIIARIRLFGNAHFHVIRSGEKTGAGASADIVRMSAPPCAYRIGPLTVNVHREVEVEVYEEEQTPVDCPTGEADDARHYPCCACPMAI